MIFSDDTLFSFSADGIELQREIRHTETDPFGGELT